MSQSKIDAIRMLLKTHSEKHVIQAVCAAYSLTEAEAERLVKRAQFIYVEEKGYPDPFIESTKHLFEEQGKPDGVALSCAPELKANNHKNIYTGWVSSIIEHRAIYLIVIEQVNLEMKCKDSCNFITGGCRSEIAKQNYYGPKIGRNIVPDSFGYQKFIDYTSENTNRA